MEKKIGFLLLVMSFGLMGAKGCSSLPYEDDIRFLNSAQANSMEWLVTIDNVVCKDVEGIVGACTKRVRSDHSPVLRHAARPYDYSIDIRCTDGLIGFSQDVPADEDWQYTLPHERFERYRSFTCTGEVLPKDRKNALSAIWQIRFVVFDTEYKERETMYIDDKTLILGRYAKYATVCQDDRCRDYKEKTSVKVDPKKVITAYSESEIVRLNYFGFN